MADEQNPNKRQQNQQGNQGGGQQGQNPGQKPGQQDPGQGQQGQNPSQKPGQQSQNQDPKRRPRPLSQQEARPCAGFFVGWPVQLGQVVRRHWLAIKKWPAGSSQRAFHLLPVLVESLRHFKMMF
jgi:hypothetical protein